MFVVRTPVMIVIAKMALFVSYWLDAGMLMEICATNLVFVIHVCACVCVCVCVCVFIN